MDRNRYIAKLTVWQFYTIDDKMIKNQNGFGFLNGKSGPDARISHSLR